MFGLCLTPVPFAALQVAFGSLYRDDVLINPSRVVALLAAACMLQLVSQKCHLKRNAAVQNILPTWPFSPRGMNQLFRLTGDKAKHDAVGLLKNAVTKIEV